LGYRGVERGGVELELMLIQLQTGDGALVAAILIIVLLFWALSR
jgi:hypothetical protein